MKKGPPLRPGDPVRVIAPSSPFDRTRFERGLRVIEELGLVPDVPQDVFAADSYLAGDDDVRLRALTTALEDPAVTAIWCARGGYGATRLLPQLLEVRPSGPKLLVGFSDISALIAFWFRHLDTTAIHAPVINSLFEETEASRDRLWQLLSGGSKGATYALEGPLPGPAVEGTLYATNLSLLSVLVGTPFQPDLEGCILAVEDVGERPYRLDRHWTHLRHSGVLDGVVAIVLGAFTDCDDPGGAVVAAEGLRRGLAGLTTPIVSGLSIGHRPPNLAIPVGVRARLEGTSLTLLEEVSALPST